MQYKLIDESRSGSLAPFRARDVNFRFTFNTRRIVALPRTVETRRLQKPDTDRVGEVLNVVDALLQFVKDDDASFNSARP